MMKALCRGFVAMLVAGAVFSSVEILPARAGDVDAAAIDYRMNATELQSACDRIVSDTGARFERILERSPQLADRNSTLLPLEDAVADADDALIAPEFLGSVSSDRTVRDASDRCQLEADHLLSDLNSRPQLAALLRGVERSKTVKTVADRKLFELWKAMSLRSGADLPAAKRSEFVALTHRLDDLETAFSANLANEPVTITLKSTQLRGLPTDLLVTFKRLADATTVVPVDESTEDRFLQNAADESARRAFYTAYANRGYPENLPLLREALAIRLRLARLLGYQTWADFVLADRMAGTPQRVHAFLDDLDATLLPRARQEAARLATLKARDLGVQKTRLEPWDLAYYDERLHRTTYAVDDDTVRKYFPVEHVVPGVLGIYAKMLGIRFSPVTPTHAWSPDVTEYAVANAADGHFIGTLYLDLYPRPGKYTHFASFPLLPVRMRADGSERPPIDAIVGNWPRPAPGDPSLLSHEDVETFFHEFGHAMAALLTTAPYETLSSGFRTDFVEAPSQMLENWVWDPAILRELSADVDGGAPMPDPLIAKLTAARYVDEALFTCQQILYADVDLAYHSNDLEPEPTARWRALARRTTPFILPDDVHPEAAFEHIMGGYDASYYGYLWSKVYAQDMFTAFQAGGLESPSVGARYRADILEPARELEPDTEVRAFLGRPVNAAAFYREFGIDRAKSPMP